MLQISDEQATELKAEARNLLERGLLAVRRCAESAPGEGATLDKAVLADLHLLADDLHNLPGVIAGDFGWYSAAKPDFARVRGRIDRLLHASVAVRPGTMPVGVLVPRWFRIATAVLVLAVGLVSYLWIDPFIESSHAMSWVLIGVGGFTLTFELLVWLLLGDRLERNRPVVAVGGSRG